MNIPHTYWTSLHSSYFDFHILLCTEQEPMIKIKWNNSATTPFILGMVIQKLSFAYKIKVPVWWDELFSYLQNYHYSDIYILCIKFHYFYMSCHIF
jgi:hypothetical protein